VQAFRPAVAAFALISAASAFAQRGPQNARSAAPVDLTGYWITVVTEDWRYRMVTPARGDHPSVPLNAAGNALANTWDPAKDEAAGEQCRAYGAAGVMRLPGRIHITWQDDATLKIETEEGTQTRLSSSRHNAPTLRPRGKGESSAQWELAGGGRAGRGAGPRPAAISKSKREDAPGSAAEERRALRRQRGPDRVFQEQSGQSGDSWLILTSIVDDPQYLTGPFIRSTHYKRLPDNNIAWEAEPCSAR
jgi:hypothetical protein